MLACIAAQVLWFDLNMSRSGSWPGEQLLLAIYACGCAHQVLYLFFRKNNRKRKKRNKKKKGEVEQDCGRGGAPLLCGRIGVYGNRARCPEMSLLLWWLCTFGSLPVTAILCFSVACMFAVWFRCQIMGHRTLRTVATVAHCCALQLRFKKVLYEE